MKKQVIGVLAIILSFSALSIAGIMDEQDTRKTHERYCAGVATWEDEAARGIPPEHRTGHPDYYQIAEKYCF